MDVWWLALACFFAYASIARTLSCTQRRNEEDRFGLARGMGWLIVAFEMWLAWRLAHEDRQAALLSILFILGATVVLVARHPREIVASIGSLCCYQASAMSVVVHLAYIVIAAKILSCS